MHAKSVGRPPGKSQVPTRRRNHHHHCAVGTLGSTLAAQEAHQKKKENSAPTQSTATIPHDSSLASGEQVFAAATGGSPPALPGMGGVRDRRPGLDRGLDRRLGRERFEPASGAGTGLHGRKFDLTGQLNATIIPIQLLWLSGNFLFQKPIRRLWWHQLRRTKKEVA